MTAQTTTAAPDLRPALPEWLPRLAAAMDEASERSADGELRWLGTDGTRPVTAVTPSHPQVRGCDGASDSVPRRHRSGAGPCDTGTPGVTAGDWLTSGCDTATPVTVPATPPRLRGAVVSLVGRPARNHPQQVGRRGARPEVDDRGTTAELFDPLNARYGPFTIDVAASAANTRCDRFYDVATDGLAQPWAGERVWCNPPFSALPTGAWTAKAWAEVDAEVIVMLLPANRTEQRWWQHHVEPYRDRPGSPLATTFLAGRPRFLAPGADLIAPNERPPFGVVVLVWTPDPTFGGPDVAALDLDGARP